MKIIKNDQYIEYYGFHTRNTLLLFVNEDIVMIKKIEPAIPFHPYPVVSGYGYRCFDGEKWVDCDKNGKPIIRKDKESTTKTHY